jgi:hypothetical protein
MKNLDRDYSETSPYMRSFKRRRRPIRRLFRPSLHILEERLAPAILLVNSVADNTSDTSHLTLRDAVSLVNNAGNPAYLDHLSMPSGWASQISGTFGDNDTIGFSSTLGGGTVALDGVSLEISTSVTITGLGASGLAISGQGRSTVITVDAGAKALVTIEDLTIEDGGVSGIHNDDGPLAISNCTLVNNSSNGLGGGVFNSGTLTVADSTFADNSATAAQPYEAFGGAIYNETGGTTYNSSTLSVTNCTFYGNTATDGGNDIATVGSVTLNNTIVASSASGGDLDTLYGERLTGTHDLIGDGSDLVDFTDSLQGNPLLAPLGNYGGPTQTMALLPGSPAIDAGSSVVAVDADGDPLTSDQRGEPYPADNPVDIGAFESQGFTISVSGGSNQTAAYHTTFAKPLTVNVSAQNPIEPVNGGVITFTPPPWAASAMLSATTTTISGGSASVTVTANDDSGPYTVTASAAGVGTPADFSLTNDAQGSSTFVVTDSGDDGQEIPGDDPADTRGGISLRSAIAAADFDAAHGLSDTIEFSPVLNGVTILLAQGQLEFTAGSGTITIDSDEQIAVSGSSKSGVFRVDAGATLDISGLTIEDGSSATGGGILNSGSLIVSSSTLTANLSGAGGGIDNVTGGTLTLINSTVAANSAGDGSGGGILNGGRLTVINSTVADNSAGTGGGINDPTSGSARLVNTIVANSTAGGDLSGVAFSGSNDFIGDGSGLASFGTSVQGNPLLAPLGRVDNFWGLFVRRVIPLTALDPPSYYYASP